MRHRGSRGTGSCRFDPGRSGTPISTHLEMTSRARGPPRERVRWASGDWAMDRPPDELRPGVTYTPRAGRAQWLVRVIVYPHSRRVQTPRSGSGRRRTRGSTPKRSASSSPRRRTPKRLGRVVARREEGDGVLARCRHDALGGLAGDERVQAAGDRVVDVVGRGAGDDARRCARRSGPSRNASGSRPGGLADAVDELAAADRRRRRSPATPSGRPPWTANGVQDVAPSAAASSALLPCSWWPSSGRW